MSETAIELKQQIYRLFQDVERAAQSDDGRSLLGEMGISAVQAALWRDQYVSLQALGLPVPSELTQNIRGIADAFIRYDAAHNYLPLHAMLNGPNAADLDLKVLSARLAQVTQSPAGAALGNNGALQLLGSKPATADAGRAAVQQFFNAYQAIATLNAAEVDAVPLQKTATAEQIRALLQAGREYLRVVYGENDVDFSQVLSRLLTITQGGQPRFLMDFAKYEIVGHESFMAAEIFLNVGAQVHRGTKAILPRGASVLQPTVPEVVATSQISVSGPRSRAGLESYIVESLVRYTRAEGMEQERLKEAGHVVLALMDYYEVADLEALAQKLGVQITRRDPSPRAIWFEAQNPELQHLENLVKNYQGPSSKALQELQSPDLTRGTLSFLIGTVAGFERQMRGRLLRGEKIGFRSDATGNPLEVQLSYRRQFVPENIPSWGDSLSVSVYRDLLREMAGRGFAEADVADALATPGGGVLAQEFLAAGVSQQSLDNVATAQRAREFSLEVRNSTAYRQNLEAERAQKKNRRRR